MKKLESKKDNAPLDWIRKTTSENPNARLTPQKLMHRILACDDEKDYYGLCCDGNEEKNVGIELRNSDIEDFSASEGIITPYFYKVLPADDFSNRSFRWRNIQKESSEYGCSTETHLRCSTGG